jgi:peptidoglycan hydrolase-like protein with peptidoglycan-binding domain
VLKNGSRGDDVKELQEELTKLGLLSGAADGIFGPKTEEAVKKCQALFGLDADGFWGKQSAEALSSR